jgi:hypothetical protein
MSDRRSESALHDKWGLLEGWLAMRPERRIEFTSGPDGLVARIVDADKRDLVVLVAISDEPSAVIWRAIFRRERGV